MSLQSPPGSQVKQTLNMLSLNSEAKFTDINRRRSQKTGKRTGNMTHTSFSIQFLDHTASLARVK